MNIKVNFLYKALEHIVWRVFFFTFRAVIIKKWFPIYIVTKGSFFTHGMMTQPNETLTNLEIDLSVVEQTLQTITCLLLLLKIII